MDNPMRKTDVENGILWLVSILAFLILQAAPLSAKDLKMKAEELVAKHLASMGTPEAIAAARSRSVSGAAQVIFRLPSPGQLDGKGSIVSDGHKEIIAMVFSAVDYPSEQLAFDGNRVTVGQVKPGRRSALSAFVYRFDSLMKEGLLGGALTTAWALLDFQGRQPKLDYTGLKKLEGKQVHELKYRAKKGAGDLRVSLYFDPETFRHVSTQILLVEPANMGDSPTKSSGQRDITYTIVESYGDFKTVDSLTLPHAYKLVMTIEGQSSTLLVEYNILAAEVVHNQTIDSQIFMAR
jgi:hypothetical protein